MFVILQTASSCVEVTLGQYKMNLNNSTVYWSTKAKNQGKGALKQGLYKQNFKANYLIQNVKIYKTLQGHCILEVVRAVILFAQWTE